MLQKKRFCAYTPWVLALLGGVLGALTFLVINGPAQLNPFNDAWIMQLYDEADLLQNYGGWLLYRASPWNFPLALAENCSYPEGMVIAFTDSIALVGVLCKALFSGFETFQYYGLFTFFCYILQGSAAALLLGRIAKNIVFISFGTLFFTFSPILMERSFRHVSLASHWLILFSLYVYVAYRTALQRDDHALRLPRSLVALNALAVGLHPYFLPATMTFTLLCCFEMWRKTKMWKRPLAFLGVNLGASYLMGYVLGTLGHGVSASRPGYGFYSMNLNALYNPVSIGGYAWSRFLKEQPHVLGNFEGFTYMGVGFLSLFVVALVLWALRCTPMRLKADLKRNGPLLVFCAFFTLFALTNVVSFNTRSFHIPLPEALTNVCGIFRASGRIFYPVYYCMLLFALMQLCHVFTGKRLWAVAGLFLCLQLYDISGVFAQKRVLANAQPQCLLQEEVLQGIGKTHTDLMIFEQERMAGHWAGILAGKEKMRTSLVMANSGDYTQAQAAGKAAYEQLRNGSYNKSTVYATSSAQEFAVWESLFFEDPDVVLFSHFADSGLGFLIPITA